MIQQTGYLSAQEAAEALEISLSTLYAYVSRGLIRSEVADASRRTHRYRAEDVARLKQRKEQRRNPGQVVKNALHWGAPLLESAITLIADNQFYYRGQEVTALARTHSLEEVAALIWANDLSAKVSGLSGPPPATSPSERLRQVCRQVESLPAVERIQVLLPLAAANDLAAYDLQPAAVMQTGAKILRLMTAAVTGVWESVESIPAQLQRGWGLEMPQAEALLNTALILCADHELNVSSFTARCVASAGATPYQVVTAGLAALQGAKHGRITERIEAFLREAEGPDGIRGALAARLKRGEPVPGFGHPLYPEGDPRGRTLLEAVAESHAKAPAVTLAQSLIQEAETVLGKLPTIDFGLVVLARTLGLPPGSPLTLFALGRTIGWIGHALEAYRSDQLIRPRARYIGQPPQS